MLVQEDIDGIFTHPDFLAVVRELLTKKDEAPAECAEADDVTQRVQRKILRRMKERHPKEKRL